ncbi:MAG TPA: metal ABC transporter ATP-binding protein [Gemmataceae bacterium]|jgi:zinc transport system ATP-binding protein
MTDALVTLRNVKVELGGTPILQGVNADITRGQMTALIGLNGSGKTTLLRAILKEVPLAGGRIEFRCGHDHTHPAPEHVGYVPQRLQIDARLPLTVRDLLGLALQRRPLFFGVGKWANDRMVTLLGHVFTDPTYVLDRPVEKLSGGELQRVLLALALDPKPELLLLDEPAAGIDFKDQVRFYDLLGRLNAETGVTIILVSHELNMVSKHAHHVLCLKDGRIQCEGPPVAITPAVLAATFGHEHGLYAHEHHHH